MWDIDRRLQQERARPLIYHNRAANYWYPQVKGVTVMVNGSYNGRRTEGVWLGK